MSRKPKEEVTSFDRPKDLPEQYRRCTGTKEKPELKGKLVSVKCKNCLWWETLPIPKGPVIKGKRPTCSECFHGNPSLGAAPEDYACPSFTHKENKKTVLALGEVSPSELKVMSQLVDILMDSQNSPSDLRGGLEKLLLNQPWQLETISRWSSKILKEKQIAATINGKVVEKDSAWVIKDEKTGETYEGIVVQSTRKKVKVLIEQKYRSKFDMATYFSYLPDKFEQIAKPLESDNNTLKEDATENTVP